MELDISEPQQLGEPPQKGEEGGVNAGQLELLGMEECWRH
jgi:hypothetical protein